MTTWPSWWPWARRVEPVPAPAALPPAAVLPGRAALSPSRRPPPSRRPGLAPGTRRGFGRTPWGAAWVNALETRARLDPNRLPRGRTYARWGHVGPLSVRPGRVEASVMGSRSSAYRVWIRVRELTATEWEALLDLISSEVGFAAALLDGELPPELVDLARAAGLDLLPGAGDLQPNCSCPDWAEPCKHAAAVCYLVGDVLDADPMAVLLLRGRSSEEVMAGLRARRSEGPAGAGSASSSGDGSDFASDPGVPAAALYRRHQAPPPPHSSLPTQPLPTQPLPTPTVPTQPLPTPSVPRPSVPTQPLPTPDVPTPTVPTPPLPTPPLPPAHPGRPAALISDPPPGSGLTSSALAALAADAARRAHALALGSGQADAALGLDLAADRARRAADLLNGTTAGRAGGLNGTTAGRAGGGLNDTSAGRAAGGLSGAGLSGAGLPSARGLSGPGGLSIDTLARAAGLSTRQLLREALAWIQGGTSALEVLEGSWIPEASELDEARSALGPGAKAWRNRITAGDRQIRIGRDGRWYPYRRSGESWDPQGTPL